MVVILLKSRGRTFLRYRLRLTMRQLCIAYLLNIRQKMGASFIRLPQIMVNSRLSQIKEKGPLFLFSFSDNETILNTISTDRIGSLL